MNMHTCHFLPSRSWSSFTDPGRMEGWVGLSGWWHNCPAQGIEPAIQVLTEPDVR